MPSDMMKKITGAILKAYSKLPFQQSAVRGKILQLVSPQEQDTSYLIHNSDYEQTAALERFKGIYEEQEKEDILNRPTLRFSELLQKYPSVRELAVDIGCGPGWLSAKLSKDFRKVIGIEPSAVAISMAKKLHNCPNVQWEIGFAEQKIVAISSEKPIAFFTSVVLSHLTDEAVITICRSINSVAPRGSILGFGEGWGKESHKYMWHIRTREWWQQNLPGWELDFFGPEIKSVHGNVGFHGVKVK